MCMIDKSINQNVLQSFVSVICVQHPRFSIFRNKQVYELWRDLSFFLKGFIGRNRCKGKSLSHFLEKRTEMTHIIIQFCFVGLVVLANAQPATRVYFWKRKGLFLFLFCIQINCTPLSISQTLKTDLLST